MSARVFVTANHVWSVSFNKWNAMVLSGSVVRRVFIGPFALRRAIHWAIKEARA